MSIGRAAVLAVFCASVYFDIWSMIQTPGNADLLSIAFVLAFLAADEPWVQYTKIIEKRFEEKKKE